MKNILGMCGIGMLALAGFVFSKGPVAGDKPQAELFGELPKDCGQLVRMVTPKEKSIQGELSRFEFSDNQWRQVGDPWPAVVGRNGIANPVVKKEGDGKTPSGTYPIGLAFGYAPLISTKLKYRQATDQDLWVDDDQSADYNRWVSAPTKAKSFEWMKRKDDLYKYGAVIEYNTNPVKAGKGSAIFLHVWPGSDRPTAGCVALSEENIKTLLGWLDQSKRPHIRIQTEISR